jgi:hypothetical protein
MPVSKIGSGLIYYEELDSLAGWSTYENYAPCTEDIDSSDKVSGSGSSYNYAPSPIGGVGLCEIYKTINVGPGGARLHLWHKISAWGGMSDPGCAEFWGARIGLSDYCYHRLSAPGGLDWHLGSGTISYSGNQTVIVNETGVVAQTGQYGYAAGHVDRIVIFASLTITLAALVPGQKVEIYLASDDSLLGTDTVGGGETSAIVTIPDSTDVPCQLYMKIYATNGTTLLETTPSYEMCGGDSWEWTAPTGTLVVSVDYDLIYRSGASGMPKTCNVTATLTTNEGDPVEGETVYFTTTLGEVDPASDVTDEDGEAHTALSSDDHGIAIAKAQFLGSETVPACSAYYPIHVFYEEEAPDESEKFQLFIQGIEYQYVRGRYTQNEVGTVDDFEAEIPEWVSTITPNGYVSIYRKGTKEFHGVLKRIKRSLSDPSRIALSGPDVSILLNDRVVDTRVYGSKTPQYIINELLVIYSCGITPGTLGEYPDTLSIPIETESLAKAIPRICDLVNWKYRVNVDRTLDFAESFTGGTTSAAFTEGVDLFSIDRDINYSPVANYIRMVGDGITSTKQDGTKIQEQGLHQAPAFNKSISDQATLDAACQALLDMKKVEEETIPFAAKDDYAPGTFGPEDYITITSATVGMSGIYQIRKIERDLTDPNVVKFDLVNRSKQYWEMDEIYRRMTKDVSV